MSFSALNSYYVLAVILGLTCFVPYRNFTIRYGNGEAKNIISEIFDDIYLKYAIVGSIALTIPVMLDEIVESVTFPMTNYKNLKTALCGLLLSAFMYSSLIFFYVIPSEHYSLAPSLAMCFTLVVFSVFLCVLNAYGGHIWRLRYITFILIVYSLHQISSSFLLSSDDLTFRQELAFVNIISEVITIALYVTLAYLWARHTILLAKNGKSITNDDVCCLLNIIVGMVFLLCELKISIDNKFFQNSKIDKKFMIDRQYLISLFAAGVVFINARLIRFNVVYLYVRREAEMKQMLLGYFSHEIRTPLNSVLMGLQVMKKDIQRGIDQMQISLTLDEMYAQCDSAVDILNDMLLYERLEEGVMDMNMKPVAMKSFILTKLKTFIEICKEKGIRLCIDMNQSAYEFHNRRYDMNNAYCRGDEDKLSQVIRTLVANAIECTPSHRQITVTVMVFSDADNSTQSRCHHHSVSRVLLRRTASSLSNDSDRNPTSFRRSQRSLQTKPTHIRVEVVDQGPIIPEEEYDTLFHKAFDFTPGVLQDSQRKGLKLWISRHIITLHHGKLLVSSNNNEDDVNRRGNVFTIELPVYFASSNGRIRFRQTGSSVSMLPDTSSSVPTALRAVVSPPNRSTSQQVMSLLQGSLHRPVATINPTLSHPQSPLSALIRAHENASSQSSLNSVVTIDNTSDVETAGDVALALNDLNVDHGDRQTSIRVLVVDDAVMNRKMLCRLLEGYCDVTVQAEDGEIAVQKVRESLLQRDAFALILMDYQMPNMDGPTATRQIRNLGFKGPIIGVTGNSLSTHIKTFTSSGANRVVSKPLNFDTLTRTLTEIGKGHVLRTVSVNPESVRQSLLDS